MKILCLTLLWGLAIVMTQTSWGVLRIVISLFEQFDFMFGIIAWPSISYFATSKENHFCGDFETFAWPKHSVWKFHKKCTLFYPRWRSCHLFDLFKMDRHGINQNYKIWIFGPKISVKFWFLTQNQNSKLIISCTCDVTWTFRQVLFRSYNPWN